MWKRVMSEVRDRVARFRVPGGVDNIDNTREADEPGYDDRPLPLAASILWKPIDNGPAGPAADLLPIFITQRVLAAVHDHCAATRETCFGLLSGNLFRAPDTGAPYVVVGSIVRLPGGTGDDAKAALLQGWVVAQDVLRRTGDQLVGWYRGRRSSEIGLAPAEAEAHATLLGQPWQVVMAVGMGDRTVGGVFRRSARAAWGDECLPFYELVDPRSLQPDGRKLTHLRWANYRTDEPALATLPVPAAPAAPTQTSPTPSPAARTARAGRAPRATPPPRASSRVPPMVFLPDQFGPGDGTRTRVLGLSGRRLGRAARFAAYAAVGILAVAGLFRLYSALAAPAPGVAPGASEAAAVTPLQRLDRAADTLALAVAAFDLRSRLFAGRQMQCPGLARGLVLVEERWTAYNAVRKDGGASLDSARTAKDKSLYADADAVERRFERSGCPRP
jgi:hypothetical protein